MGWMGLNGVGLTEAVPVCPHPISQRLRGTAPQFPPVHSRGQTPYPTYPTYPTASPPKKTPTPVWQRGQMAEGGNPSRPPPPPPPPLPPGQTRRGCRSRAGWRACRSARSAPWRNTSAAATPRSPGASGGFCCVCPPCAASPPPPSSSSSSCASWAKPPSRPSSATCCSPGRPSAGPTAPCSDGGTVGVDGAVAFREMGLGFGEMGGGNGGQ